MGQCDAQKTGGMQWHHVRVIVWTPLEFHSLISHDEIPLVNYILKYHFSVSDEQTFETFYPMSAQHWA